MILVHHNNIKRILEEGKIKFSLHYPISKGKHFVLSQDVKVALEEEAVITIPEGFTFDGSSVPRFLWWLFPSYGDFFFAALLHDYLYQTKFMCKEIGVYASQKLADEEMLHWSNIINDKNIFKKTDNYLRFVAVRWFGKKVYIK